MSEMGLIESRCNRLIVIADASRTRAKIRVLVLNFF